MTSALTYLAIEYANFEKRAEVEELDLVNKNLSGELDFTHLGFTNLKKLILTNNQITKLVLTNPQQITHLDINNNQISDFRVVDGLVEKKLEHIEHFEFINNPLPVEFKRLLLKSR
jgi:Leucine-rich repeat (LRR) protein